MGVIKGGPKGQEEDTSSAELTKSEQKAAPDAQVAIDHPENFDTGGPVTSLPPGEAELSTYSTHPRSVLIGSGEMQIDTLALEAKRDSGLTTANWNELGRDERTKLLDTTIARLRGEAESEKFSTDAAAGDTTTETKDVRVHETRGIGGRFVALGGGERVRVADASTDPSDPIVDDADLQNA